jgi:ubiquinone/menaquinone biosynthesis C-methylase UbiE
LGSQYDDFPYQCDTRPGKALESSAPTRWRSPRPTAAGLAAQNYAGDLFMTQTEQYVLGYKSAEQQRLQQQAQQLAHESRWLFDQIGVASGARVVEIGCGPHGCLEILAELVGPTGRVVGVERNQDAVGLACTLIAERGLKNVEVLCRDARSTDLPRGQFDLATARLVLVNIPQPEQVIAEAVSLVRSGGSIAFHEADWIGHVCDPPSSAWNRIVELFVTYSQRNGIDPFIGRKLPRLLRQAGVNGVRVNPIVHVYPDGHPRRCILLDFVENLSERVVADKLVGEEELADLKAALRRDVDDPGTLVVSHLFFQAWGRKGT